MPWTVDTWDAFHGLVEEAWPGDFDDHAARRWRVLLNDTEPEHAIRALKTLLHEGHRFRPSVSEVLAAATRDPARPTFDEALELIRHCLRARPPRTGATVRYQSPADRDRAIEQAILDRAANLHPLVAAFLHRHGPLRLRLLELDDPDYGAVRRRDLREAWDAHVAAFAGRSTAALATGRGRGELARLDPLTAITTHNGQAPQLTEGDR